MSLPDAAPQLVSRENSAYPQTLVEKLGARAPGAIAVFGPAAPLASTMVGLFCSRETPGATILKALDQAAKWREDGTCVISGFHSPLERECLTTLLRGSQPIVMASARAINSLRLEAGLRRAYAEGRLSVVAAASSEARTTATSSHERNRLVAALATEAVFAYIKPGGSLSRLTEEIVAWGGRYRVL